MGKRKKENKMIFALELYKRFLHDEPDLAEQAKAAIEEFKSRGVKWNEDIVYCPTEVPIEEIRKTRMGDSSAKYFKKLSQFTGGLISAMITWGLSKVIYNFDEDFFYELKQTEGLEKVPIEALLHLPYKCLCLQMKDETRFVYLNYDFGLNLYELKIERFFWPENRLNNTNYSLILSSKKLGICGEIS